MQNVLVCNKPNNTNNILQWQVERNGESSGQRSHSIWWSYKHVVRLKDTF